MLRDVQPEILDTLPENHRDALANRRDMRRINRLMGNFEWIADRLREIALPPHSRIVEIAAGDGALGAFIEKSIPGAREWNGVGVDLWSRPDQWPEPWLWEKADVRFSPSLANADVIIANHILHQFNGDELRELGPRLTASAHTLIINETCRRTLHVWQARIACILGFNHVSRHDAVVSVRAGFRDEELPDLLGLDAEQWEWSVVETGMGAYRLFARRRDSNA